MSAEWILSDGVRRVRDMELWGQVNRETIRRHWGDGSTSKQRIAESDAVIFDLVDRGFLE